MRPSQTRKPPEFSRKAPYTSVGWAASAPPFFCLADRDLAPHLAAGAGQARGDHLVDPPPVEADNLEAPALRIDDLAGCRQVVQVRQDIAGERLVVAAFRQVDAEMIGHLVGRQV